MDGGPVSSGLGGARGRLSASTHCNAALTTRCSSGTPARWLGLERPEASIGRSLASLAAVPGPIDSLLGEVLGRLLHDAVRFSEAGQVSLVVSLEQDDAGAGLRFAVCDTGPGIAPDQLPRCFEPFTQVDESDTRCHGGTGLGLPPARWLVSRTGGVLGADSAPGMGRSFWFRLPLGGAATRDADRGGPRPDAASAQTAPSMTLA